MKRKEFLKVAAATAAIFAAQGYLPLLAAQRDKRAQRPEGSGNCFIEPCAIEPITGYLGQFTPVAGTMTGNFSARYALIHWQSAGAKSKNLERGSMDIVWKAGNLNTKEIRTNRPANTVKTSIQCAGEWNAAKEWTLDSSIDGRKENGFVETGTWDGKAMTVKSKSWTQKDSTGNPLIARWALLPLLASGKIKKAPLTFDMLEDSTLRANQTIRYEGETSIPVKDGTARLLSYVQTGDAVVPTHYMVDVRGRVQLITMSMVNWALAQLKG
jgi:hypothetical protein